MSKLWINIRIAFAALALSIYAPRTFGMHLVSDAISQSLQNAEIAEAVNIVKTGAEQVRAIISVYNEIREVYDIIGNVRNTFDNFSNYWDTFQSQWSFDNSGDFDSFMSTADSKLGRWGIQPATSGVLGDAVARSKSFRYGANDGASDIRNMPYDYSRDNVLRSPPRIPTGRSLGCLIPIV